MICAPDSVASSRVLYVGLLMGDRGPDQSADGALARSRPRGRYARPFVVGVGLVAVVVFISVITPRLHYNRASYVGTLVVVLIAWTPAVLLARGRAFTVASFGVAALIVVMELGLTAATLFPVAWLFVAPLLIATALPVPPPDARTFGVLAGATATGIVIAVLFATTVPVADTLVKACRAGPASTAEIDDALRLEDFDFVNAASYNPTAVGVQVRPYTPESDIDRLVTRAEMSPLFSRVDIGDVVPCATASGPSN